MPEAQKENRARFPNGDAVSLAAAAAAAVDDDDADADARASSSPLCVILGQFFATSVNLHRERESFDRELFSASGSTNPRASEEDYSYVRYWLVPLWYR
mmetsp:Transcript_18509/g.51467  ORF Transcript_18509/g.51467 Transcript_18509/m.51467 type:complete len:99 (+) Transcript_18509:74-370(+)